MKKLNTMLRKCKTLSKQLSRTSSDISSRSNSARHHLTETTSNGIIWNTIAISIYGDNNLNESKEEPRQLVVVGSTRKRYVIKSKYLVHPLVNALIVKSKTVDDDDEVSIINCEIVLFDHLLWMLENADFNVTSDCLDELADLYSS